VNDLEEIKACAESLKEDIWEYLNEEVEVFKKQEEIKAKMNELLDLLDDL
jgi:hypothetical protein